MPPPTREQVNALIEPDKITVGQYITIHRWHPYPNGCEDHSWCGDVLQVKAICLPYIVVSHARDAWLSPHTRIDTRRVDLMELSAEYVAAAHARKEATP